MADELCEGAAEANEEAKALERQRAKARMKEKFDQKLAALLRLKRQDNTAILTQERYDKIIASAGAHLGGQGYERCLCTTGCKTNRCGCRRAGKLCNSKCHGSNSCKNK